MKWHFCLSILSAKYVGLGDSLIFMWFNGKHLWNRQIGAQDDYVALVFLTKSSDTISPVLDFSKMFQLTQNYSKYQKVYCYIYMSPFTDCDIMLWSRKMMELHNTPNTMPKKDAWTCLDILGSVQEKASFVHIENFPYPWQVAICRLNAFDLVEN